MQRGRTERKHRRVGVRPAPDTMAVLTGYLPVEQGIACYAALRQHADTAVATGDGRTRDQIMADTLVERLTGQTRAQDLDIELQIMMPLDTLINPDDHRAATIPGYGPLPADLAKEMISHSGGHKWWRRLFTAPTEATGTSGPIVGGDPDPALLRRLARQAHPAPRPDLQRSVLRRTHPAHRPHQTPRRWRTHHIHKWTRGVRTRQPGSGNARMARHPHRLRLPRRAAHHPHHHTHRPPLSQPRPRSTMTGKMTDLAPATVLELRKAAGTPARRWLLILSAVVGLLSAGLVTFTGSAQDHTFAVISFYTQSAISLPLPFVSVLLMTQDFGRRMRTTLHSASHVM